MKEISESSFIEKKLNYALWMGVSIDCILPTLLCGILTDGLPVYYNLESLVNAIVQQGSRKGLILGAYYLINIVLLLSPLKATLGMLFVQIKWNPLGEDYRLKIIQTTGYFLTSPIFISYIFIIVYSAYFNFQFNLYYAANATVLFWGIYSLTHLIYHFKYGGSLKAQESILNVSVTFGAKKLQKIKENFHRRKDSLTHRPIISVLYKCITTPLVVLSLYLSILVIADLFKEPYLENEIYKPDITDWTHDNGYFAFEGLSAPADTKDFVDFGRSFSYQNFLVIDDLKKQIKNFPRFESPAANSFELVDRDFEPLDFQHTHETHKYNFFDCYDQIQKKDSDKICATDKDIVDTIAKNKILWDRFNQLPDFKDFQRPDIGIHGMLRGQTLISLSSLKVADIIRLQKSGHSQEALNEWVRFEKFYRQLVEAKNTMVGKAIFMMVFGVHHQGLEKLLYNDPQLADNHYDLIAATLNPQGVSMFNAHKMFADDFSQAEIYLLPALYPSPGIRNKMFDCMKEQEALVSLPAVEFPFENISSNMCNNLQTQPINEIAQAVFLTTGNPITSIIQQLLYGGFIKGGELISNMHIKDAEMRMALLGAKIYKDNIAPKDIANYIQSAPIELQNPITQKPFEWDGNNNNLFFLDPNNDGKFKTFSINLATP